MEKFKQLGLSEGMLFAIKNAGFTEPSEIQLKTIPLVISGKDVIGSSATGSGKTLAFGAGIIDKIKRGNGIEALILVPTRELAEQVASTLRKFSKHSSLVIREVYGGMPMGPQIRDLRNADIVVGTPGRILDHLQRRTLILNKMKFLVLDEADRMLDMGFIRDVETILRSCPKERQTLLFSATISDEIDHIARRHMIDPVHISVNNQVDPSKLYQVYYDISRDMKFSLLMHLLKLEKNGVVMVFCNTRRNVDRLTSALHHEGIRALAIHGGLSQNKRSSTLQAFHERETLILVCTDVAARGLDIKEVSHVYNFDIPATPTDYIHRIGRTARAGKNGIAISFVCSGDNTEFRQISKSLKIERLNAPALSHIVQISFSSNEDRKINRQNGRNRGRSSGRGGGGRGRGFSEGRRESGGWQGRGRPQRGRNFSRPGHSNRGGRSRFGRR